MLDNHFALAAELFADRRRAAERERLARELPVAPRTSAGTLIRRNGARVAAAIAQRLDECAARSTFERLSAGQGR